MQEENKIKHNLQCLKDLNQLSSCSTQSQNLPQQISTCASVFLFSLCSTPLFTIKVDI